MGDTNVLRSLSLQEDASPKDLLQRFAVALRRSGTDPGKEEEGAEEEEDDLGEVELSLGLSLGGRFGVDKSSELVRSSSVSGSMPTVTGNDDVLDPVGFRGGLLRTCSMPMETEEWRKRKEMQSLRRMAAKRRRSEKQRMSSRGEREEHGISANRVGPTRSWAVAARLGSVDSYGVSSSGLSELDSKPPQGSSIGRALSPVSLQERGSLLQAEAESSTKKRGKEIGLNSVENMPCVFTRGDGPNGRRIEGILYRYGKGQEVRIMCVCHGSFLSPAEFVGHAGGTDLAHPLRHILVNLNSSSLF